MRNIFTAESPQCTWSLRERTSGFDSAIIDVSKGRVIVGRRSVCDITVADSTVSSQHAELSRIGQDMIVTDLGSTNGTFVNGHQLSGPVHLREGDSLQFGTVVFQVRCERFAVDQATNLDLAVNEIASYELARRAIRELNDDDLEPWFQPIVSICDQQVVAQELLTRGRRVGLKSAGELFQAAEAADLADVVSEQSRRLGVAAAAQVDSGQLYFVNTHPAEFRSSGLIDSLEELRADFPDIRLVLEIHEKAMTNRTSMQELAIRMMELDVELAYDDFGAGSSRILEILEVPPAYVKFDIEFIKSICEGEMQIAHADSLLNALRQMDVCLLAEGIETQQQHQICQDLGFQLGQGFFYSRPLPVSEFRMAHLTRAANVRG